MKLAARALTTSHCHRSRLSSVARGSLRPISSLESARPSSLHLDDVVFPSKQAPMTTPQTRILRELREGPPRLEDVYEVSGLLGRTGGQGTVRLGRHKETGKTVAVRAVPKQGAEFETPMPDQLPEGNQVFDTFEDDENYYFAVRTTHKPQSIRPCLEDVYEVSGLLGQTGGQGTVRLGRHKEMGRTVAVRAVPKQGAVFEAPTQSTRVGLEQCLETFESDDHFYFVTRSSLASLSSQEMKAL